MALKAEDYKEWLKIMNFKCKVKPNFHQYRSISGLNVHQQQQWAKDFEEQNLTRERL